MTDGSVNDEYTRLVLHLVNCGPLAVHPCRVSKVQVRRQKAEVAWTDSVETEIEKGLLWPEPWLALDPRF